jgi:hypothetical protein
MSRGELQDLPRGDFLARGIDPGSLVSHPTSGTSGEALQIWRTPFEFQLLCATRLRTLFRPGVSPGGRRVVLDFVTTRTSPCRSV